MNKLLDGFAALRAVALVRERLAIGREVRVGGLWGSSKALLAAVLLRERPGPAVFVVADDEEGDRLVDDLAVFAPERPAWLLVTQDRDHEGRLEPVSLRERLRVLERVRSDRDRFVVVLPLAALLDPVPAPDRLAADRLVLAAGERHAPEALLARAVQAGLARVPVVAAPGEVSLRGDILDLFPAGAEKPVRLEFFDEVLESMRAFDPETQRSTGVLAGVDLPLYRTGAGRTGSAVEHLLHHDLLVVRVEPTALEERTRRLTLPGEQEDGALPVAERTLALTRVLSVSSLPAGDIDIRILAAGSGASQASLDPVARVRALTTGADGRLLVVCRNDGERDRFRDFLVERGLVPSDRLRLLTGKLNRGFRVNDSATTVVSHGEFLGTGEVRRPTRREVSVPSRAVASFFDLQPGELVVHAVHGVARYEGLTLMERMGGVEDHLKLRFKDDVLLLVPASKIDLVQKFIGAGGSAPPLDKIGGKGFARRKAEVEKALLDMAADLLEIQAVRAKTPGIAFPPDDEAIRSFEAAFPFEETADQEVAMVEIKRDMESDKPMDRLLCGDVGFGKTELAMRAAFKVVMAGKQTALLVPTTVLAEQHLRTFRERMADWPIRVEVLSRFHSKREHQRVIADAAKGSVDILIGTHRLLSGDVRFADLGLLVIDEEQRFGVAHKEKVKRLRATVDVLTMTATPIPRTLHMSLLGIRDISALTTAPTGRQDVETVVMLRDLPKMAEAIRRELARGGQVFFLHNRVETIDTVAHEVRSLVPEAKIVIGHGQMGDEELEEAVHTFVEGKADILVSTTIIESGVDIPRANTMFIDQAHMFGLAELHQLRGRVGRTVHKAHCYLLLDPAAPPNEEARKRLKAVEELSALGSGFSIAMKDLEIRGAGNILGPEQSGHIGSVGYDMFCRLLRSATAQVKEEAVVRPDEEVDLALSVEAFLPEDFVKEPQVRLEVLREMDRSVSQEAWTEIRTSLVDRFGQLPAPAENLLTVFLVKHLLLALSVRGVHFIAPDQLMVRHPPARPLSGDWIAFFAEARPVEPGRTHLVLPPTVRKPADVLRFLKASLLGEEEAGRMSRAWAPAQLSPPSSPRSPRRPRRRT